MLLGAVLDDGGGGGYSYMLFFPHSETNAGWEYMCRICLCTHDLLQKITPTANALLTIYSTKTCFHFDFLQFPAK